MPGFFRQSRIFAALTQALLLILLYRDLEVPMPLRLLSLGLFALSCWWRADTGLALVAFTTPLYLIPVSLSGILAHEIHFPLNEMALVAMLPVVALRWLLEGIRQRSSYTLRSYLPHLLFLLAGVLGVILALAGSRGSDPAFVEARAAALREFRWLIAEPLLFYVLLRRFGSLEERIPPVVWGLSLAAAGVAFLGLMQFIGYDLVPPLGWKRTFSDNVTMVGSLRRVASVYGHPNNLGLFLERCWPLALGAALLIRRQQRHWQTLVLAGCTLLSIAGLVVSFSRGAWLGSVLAVAILGSGVWGLGIRRAGDQARRRPGRLGVDLRVQLGLVLMLLLTLVGLAALELRGGGGSESTRLLLWREALGYIAQHPLGIGLDQFYAYHLPSSGRSLIAPSLIGTSEEHAAHPHNLLLDIWLRLGPLGLLAFGWLLWRFYRDGLRRWSDVLVPGAVAAMSAGLVHGVVDHFYFVPDIAFIFWTLIALVEVRGRSAQGLGFRV